MVRWIVGSILHGVDPLSWCNKGMCYPVCGMVHIKEPLLLIEKNSPCGRDGAYKRTSSPFGDSRFPLSLSEWSFNICLMPYHHKYNVLIASLNKKTFPLFNDALITFYLQLYGVRNMVKDHSDSKRGNLLSPNGLLVLLYAPSLTKIQYSHFLRIFLSHLHLNF